MCKIAPISFVRMSQANQQADMLVCIGMQVKNLDRFQRDRAALYNAHRSVALDEDASVYRVDIFQDLLRLAFLHELHRCATVKAGQRL